MSRKNIKIPEELYKKIREIVEDTGFGSVTEFVRFVLRDVASQGKFEGPEELSDDMAKVRERLKKLGYLDR